MWCRRTSCLRRLSSTSLSVPSSSLRKVVVVDKAEAADDAVRLLLHDLGTAGDNPRGRVLGFDTEWTPAKVSGIGMPPAALVQLSSEGVAVLLRVSSWLQAGWEQSCPPLLADVLLDPAVLIAGQDVRGEAASLARRLGLPSAVTGVVDTMSLAATLVAVGPPPEEGTDTKLGLKSITHRYLGLTMTKPKRVQMSTWDRPSLTPDQVDYAALDAWVSRSVFLTMADRFAALRGMEDAPYAHIAAAATAAHTAHVDANAEDVGPCTCPFPTKVAAFTALAGMSPNQAVVLRCRQLGLRFSTHSERSVGGFSTYCAVLGKKGGIVAGAQNEVPATKGTSRQVAALRLLHALCDRPPLLSAALWEASPGAVVQPTVAPITNPDVIPVDPADFLRVVGVSSTVALDNLCAWLGAAPPEFKEDRSRSGFTMSVVVNDWTITGDTHPRRRTAHQSAAVTAVHAMLGPGPPMRQLKALCKVCGWDAPTVSTVDGHQSVRIGPRGGAFPRVGVKPHKAWMGQLAVKALAQALRRSP